MKKVLISSAVVLSVALTACSGNDNKSEGMPMATEHQVSSDSNSAEKLSVSEAKPTLPSFTVLDVNGKILNMQSLKGKKVFVNLWASWCPPCLREMPSIEKLFKAVDKDKVVFVMLSLDDSFDKAEAFVKHQQLSLPIYYPAENLPAMFNVQGIPTTFIFDEAGSLLRRIDGGDEYNSPEYHKLMQ